ncbi:MAG: ribokinase [Bacteroidaceae bacterium]|nr:ribokinase [Bacteroidaceae bacterium]
MQRKIVVIGSCNTDMVISMDHLPLPGETLIGGEFFMNSGGKGANQAVAAARLGGNVSFIAKVGNDPFGKRALEQYRAEGIDVKHILTDPEQPSGVALIMVDAQGENSIAVASGANAHLTTKDIDNAKEILSRADIVLMQLETPITTVEHAANVAKRSGAKVILNPAPAQPLPESLLQNLYILIANETEAEFISGTQITDMDSVARAADILCDKGVEKVVITLGSRGAFVKERGNYHQIPGLKVKAVDATAAGDTFCGALCVALAEGKNLTEAVTFANRCAAVTVTRMGAQSSLPYRSEIEEA